MSQADEVRNALKANKLVIGWNGVEKAVKAGSVKKVFVSRTAPDIAKSDLVRLQTLGLVVEAFDGTASELGVLCKKPFPVSVLGVKE